MKKTPVKAVIIYCYNSEIPRLRQDLEPRLKESGYPKVMYRNRQFYQGEVEQCAAIITNPSEDNELLHAQYTAAGIEVLDINTLFDSEEDDAHADDITPPPATTTPDAPAAPAVTTPAVSEPTPAAPAAATPAATTSPVVAPARPARNAAARNAREQ